MKEFLKQRIKPFEDINQFFALQSNLSKHYKY